MRAWLFSMLLQTFHNLTTALLLAIIILINNFMTKVSVCKALAIGLFSYNICQEIKLLDWSIWMFRNLFFFKKIKSMKWLPQKSHQVGQLIASGSLVYKILNLAWKPKTDSARENILSVMQRIPWTSHIATTGMAESECPAMELTCWGKPHNEDLQISRAG